MRKSNIAIINKMHAVELSKVRKKLTILKKKLTKKQLKTLDNYQTQHVIEKNRFMRSLGLKIVATKTDFVTTISSIYYVKYKILKMKKPKLSTPARAGGDPYTCGPEYFRSSSGYFYSNY